MADAFSPGANVPRGEFDFDHRPETDQAFENALVKARDGDRLMVDDAIELLTRDPSSSGLVHDIGVYVGPRDQERSIVIEL